MRSPTADHSEPELPPLFGRHVYLRPVTPADYAFLQWIELGSDISMRWRFRGATPSADQWAQTLHSSVLAQHLVIDRRDDTPVGLAIVYRASFQDRHAYLAATKFNMADRSPLMMLGLALFLRFVFACWDFRRLYMESAEYNYTQFASGAGRAFEIAARLRDHLFLCGRYWDQLILVIPREQFLEYAARALQAETVQLREATPRVTIRVPGRAGE
jgi:hypothetical protein